MRRNGPESNQGDPNPHSVSWADPKPLGAEPSSTLKGVQDRTAMRSEIQLPSGGIGRRYGNEVELPDGRIVRKTGPQEITVFRKIPLERLLSSDDSWTSRTPGLKELMHAPKHTTHDSPLYSGRRGKRAARNTKGFI